MKGELKAGGLALVYGLRVRPEGNGKCVRLIGLASYRQSELLAMALGEPVERWWRVYGLLPGNEVAQVRAQNLLPIDGDDQFLDSATGEGLNRLAEQFGFKPAELTA